MEPIHKGHRKRVEEKITNHGFPPLLDHELLEYLLFAVLPQQDTNPLAHRLIDTFGSLAQVLEASPYELRKVSGIGPKTALHLSSYLAVTKRYLLSCLGEKPVMDSAEKRKRYFEALCMGSKYECAYAMYLDKSKHLLKVDKLSEGGLDSTSIYPEKIVEAALIYGSYYVVLGHNHPSGILTPSAEDILLAKSIAASVFAVRKYLLDFIITDHTNSISFVELGLLENGAVITSAAAYEDPDLEWEYDEEKEFYN